jgi:hypothetical protein
MRKRRDFGILKGSTNGNVFLGVKVQVISTVNTGCETMFREDGRGKLGSIVTKIDGGMPFMSRAC